MGIFQSPVEPCLLAIHSGFQKTAVTDPGRRDRIRGVREVLRDRGIDPQHVVDGQNA